MQNCYTGDIGDFGKLGLLRQLQKTRLSIGINWYLVPDENHKGDGSFTKYFEKDKHLAACDETLWNSLQEIVYADRRNVKELEKPAILPAKWYDAVLDFSAAKKPARKDMREQWFQKSLDALSGCDLIFVDPDNGLICHSAENTKRSNKYVLTCELEKYYDAGASVIYYQHKARRKDAYYQDQYRELQNRYFPGARGAGLKFTKTSLRYYFFIIQPAHAAKILPCLEQMLTSNWGQLFCNLYTD